MAKLDKTYEAALNPEHLLVQHLTVNGDGSGAHNVNGVYTAGTDDGVFYIAPPAGSVYYVTDIHIHVEDTAIRPDYYHAAGALANGMLLQVVRAGTVIMDINGGEAIKKTAQWSHVLDEVVFHNTGAGNAYMAGNLSWLTSAGRALVLDGDRSDIIRIVGQDDLSGLVDHEFLVQGDIAVKRTRS